MDSSYRGVEMQWHTQGFTVAQRNALRSTGSRGRGVMVASVAEREKITRSYEGNTFQIRRADVLRLWNTEVTGWQKNEALRAIWDARKTNGATPANQAYAREFLRRLDAEAYKDELDNSAAWASVQDGRVSLEVLKRPISRAFFANLLRPIRHESVDEGPCFAGDERPEMFLNAFQVCGMLIRLGRLMGEINLPDAWQQNLFYDRHSFSGLRFASIERRRTLEWVRTNQGPKGTEDNLGRLAWRWDDASRGFQKLVLPQGSGVSPAAMRLVRIANAEMQGLV